MSIYESELPLGNGIGLNRLDEYIRWDTKQVNIITGFSNDGKSEFLDFINVRLNQLYGWKTLYYSPENLPIEQHLAKLVSKMTNKVFAKDMISKEELFETANHLKDNFFFYKIDQAQEIDEILNTAKGIISQEGIKVLVLDPWNYIAHQNNSTIDNDYVSDVMSKLCLFAKLYDVLIFLVAHAKKPSGKGDKPTIHDICGSSNFGNKADNCLLVYRNKNPYQEMAEIHTLKVRFKNYGSAGKVVYLNYDRLSGNYYETEDPLDCF